jgi:dihydroflavonol-4-reductase
MERKTVVTGGAGFIGSHLVERLAGAGERVRVVERPGAVTDRLPAGVEVVRADVRDRAAISRAMEGAGVVYHLAANPNLWTRDRGEFDAVNHQGTVHVLEAARAAGARRIVHCSTESILTRADQSGAIDEQVEVREADAVGPYCLSKLKAEQAALACAGAGWPVLVANPTMPVGPGDWNVSPPTRLILDFMRGKIPATIEGTLNLVDVRQVAEGLQRVAERGEPGRRYLLGGENLTITELFGMLSRLTGRPAPRWRIPYAVALGYAYVSEAWADWVTHRMPQASVTGVRLTRRIMHFDTTRSQRELGLHPRPIEATLREMLAWIDQVHLISRN